MMEVQKSAKGLTRPGQFEGAGWRAAIRSYAVENPKARAIDIANALGCSEADALSGLSDAVWVIPGEDMPKMLAEISAWGPVLVLVRNEDAVAEVKVSGDRGSVKDDWLNWIEEGYNLHIRIAATCQVLALARPGKRGMTYSINLVNQAGQVFCRFYTRTPDAKARFLTFCRAYKPEITKD